MPPNRAQRRDIIIRAIKTKAAVQEAQDKKTDAIVAEMTEKLGLSEGK